MITVETELYAKQRMFDLKVEEYISAKRLYVHFRSELTTKWYSIVYGIETVHMRDVNKEVREFIEVLTESKHSIIVDEETVPSIHKTVSAIAQMKHDFMRKYGIAPLVVVFNHEWYYDFVRQTDNGHSVFDKVMGMQTVFRTSVYIKKLRGI